jgi:hypothetical protein
MEAQAPLETGVLAPVFLTAAQVVQINRFINEKPSARPQLLMPVGAIKSGKSTLLHKVLPGLLSAAYAEPQRWPAGRGRPVIFSYSFPLGADAEAAALHLHDNLGKFAAGIGVPFDELKCDPSDKPRRAFNTLPGAIHDFAKRVRDAGGELWLLWDELQAPILASTPSQADAFTQAFKDVSVCGPG